MFIIYSADKMSTCTYVVFMQLVLKLLRQNYLKTLIFACCTFKCMVLTNL